MYSFNFFLVIDTKYRFQHDQRNRLTRVQKGLEVLEQSYDDYGRLADNPKRGEYHYNTPSRYAIDSITLNASGLKYYRAHPRQDVQYNLDRKAVSVHEHEFGWADFAYNAQMQRTHAWYGGEEENLNNRTYQKHYSSLFPAEITVEKGTSTGSAPKTTIVHYIGGDGYTAPVAKINDEVHYLHRDYLGSILAITDGGGNLIEERQFSAWGEVDFFKQNGQDSDFSDSILPRGFTGHEHFTEIALIHMNGRMYDPQMRRFLSPDNFVQDPYDTRSYDRFGYVWNNPLMNSDPSGEIVWFAVAIGAFLGAGNAMMNGGDLGDILLGALIGGLAGGLGAGVGNAVAGSLGFSSALSVSGFGAGFTVGFAGGFVGGFVGATLNGIANGQNIGQALHGGVNAGLVAGVLGGITAGIGAGIKAKKAGANFWDGSKETPLVSNVNEITRKGVSYIETQSPQGDLGGLRRIQPRVLNSPVGDAPITSAFGVDRSVGTSPHIGTDYGVVSGTPFRATANGIAERVYYSDTLGNTVILNHGTSPEGGNVYSLYAHGNSTTVIQGQSVSVGQNVLLSGNTGSTSLGAHLHYEVIKTLHSPFSPQFFGNIGERYAPSSLSSLLGY